MTSETSAPTVDLDRAPLSAPSRFATQDRSTSNVDGGLNVVRRRPAQRFESTIRSRSTITNALSKTCDESSDIDDDDLTPALILTAAERSVDV